MKVAGTTTMIDAGQILRLLQWLSPSFPVGAYTYSHGIEYAVDARLVTNGSSLQEWIEGALFFGSGKTDGLFFRQSWLAASKGDKDSLDKIVILANAFRPTSEMALESVAQGKAFIRCINDIEDIPALKNWLYGYIKNNSDVAYAVVVGAAAGFAGIPLRESLSAFLHAFVVNLISAGIRIIPLGQTTGQKITSRLDPGILTITDEILNMEIEDIGSACPMIDWTSIKHETQYTRLFRS